MIAKLTAYAKESLRERFADTAFLEELADSLAVRRN